MFLLLLFLKPETAGAEGTLPISLFTTHRLGERKGKAYQGGIRPAHHVSPTSLNCRRAQRAPLGNNGRLQTTSKSNGMHIKDLLHRRNKGRPWSSLWGPLAAADAPQSLRFLSRGPLHLHPKAPTIKILIELWGSGGGVGGMKPFKRASKRKTLYSSFSSLLQTKR